jgi:hypothetical protein
MSAREPRLPVTGPIFPDIGLQLNRLIALLLCAAVLGACESTNQTVGTAGGAGVGAIIGKIVGGNSGALIGAGVGAVVGNLIGRQLDAHDQAKLEEAKRAAQASNQPTRFYASSVKSDVLVGPKTYTASRPALLLADDVGQTQLTVISPKTTSAHVDTPLYRHPVSGEAPKMMIEKGTPLTAIATVDGSPWTLVGRGDYGIGYVPNRYLTEQAAAAHGSTAHAATSTVSHKSAPIAPPQSKPVQSGPTTDQLLNADANYVPSASQAPVAETSQADYERVSYQGQAQAAAVKNGQTGSGAGKLTNANVVCHDLTTTLLSNHSSETSVQCGNDPPVLRQ